MKIIPPGSPRIIRPRVAEARITVGLRPKEEELSRQALICELAAVFAAVAKQDTIAALTTAVSFLVDVRERNPAMLQRVLQAECETVWPPRRVIDLLNDVRP